MGSEYHHNHRWLHLEVLKASELTPNSTRYERFIAGPTEEDARIMWITWSSLAGAVALVCCVVFIGILSSPKARKSAFNVYILFLIFPDILFNLSCLITCAINASLGHYVSNAMCQWQSWYVVFNFTANSWMNAVIALELQRLLRDCKKAHYYRPPSIGTVVIRGSAVYLYSAFVASWSLLGFLPYNATAGLACMPVEDSIESTKFFWLVFAPAFFGIPFLIFLYVCFDVVKHKMLPANGRTRHLFLFFMRLSIVFVLMWLPSIILIFALGVPDVWWSFVGGAWSHLQALVSVACCLTKSDVCRAVVNTLCCQHHDSTAETEEATWYGFLRRRYHSSVIYLQSSRLRDVVGDHTMELAGHSGSLRISEYGSRQRFSNDNGRSPEEKGGEAGNYDDTATSGRKNNNTIIINNEGEETRKPSQPQIERFAETTTLSFVDKIKSDEEQRHLKFKDDENENFESQIPSETLDTGGDASTGIVAAPLERLELHDPQYDANKIREQSPTITITAANDDIERIQKPISSQLDNII